MNRGFLRRVWVLKGRIETQLRMRRLRREGARIGAGCRLLTDSLGSEPYLVEIGDETTITSGVRFITHDGGTWVFRDQVTDVNRFGIIRIGRRCFVGVNAILLPGTCIGDRCIVGAGAVVKGDFPSGVVIAGVPAKITGTVEEYKQRAIAESIDMSDCPPGERRRCLAEILWKNADSRGGVARR